MYGWAESGTPVGRGWKRSFLPAKGGCAMKIWSDFSVLLKLALVCVIVGFILGLCSSGLLRPLQAIPSPSPTPSEIALQRWPTRDTGGAPNLSEAPAVEFDRLS